MVFCQQGSTTVRCLQVSQLTPVKGSKEKPGGQLRTDNKKPIVALAAAPCQKLEVLVLYADGSLSSCTCNPAIRTFVTRWCIAVDPARTVLHQVHQPHPQLGCHADSSPCFLLFKPIHQHAWEGQVCSRPHVCSAAS